MEEIIKKLNCPLVEVEIITEYLKQFENYELISEDITNNDAEICISCGEEIIKIYLDTIVNGKFLSIYRYHSNGVKYEQIDVVFYNKDNNKYDRVIKYSGHVEDDNFSYIVCSGFSYLNNEIIRSWKKTRVVPISDLELIQYSKDMNLTELILMANEKSQNIVEKENKTNVKKLEFKIDKSINLGTNRN